MALEEQGQGLGDRGVVAVNGGVRERRGFTAVSPGDSEGDHIAAVVRIFNQQLADLGNAGIDNIGVDDERHAGLTRVEQQGGWAAGIGTGTEKGIRS